MVFHFGKNRPARSLYAAYAGYLPAEIPSLKSALPWNNTNNNKHPAMLQLMG